MAVTLTALEIAADEVARVIAYVRSTFPNGVTVIGSGALVGRNDLLTATHVLYNPSRGGLANRVEVYFGATINAETGLPANSIASFTIRNPDILHFASRVFAEGSNDTVTDVEAASDVAILGLTQDIGFDLGWLELMSTAPPAAFLAASLGYPTSAAGLTVGSISGRYTVMRNVIFSSSTDAYQMGSGSSGGPLLLLNAQGEVSAIIGVKSGVGDTEGVWSNLSQHYQSLMTEIAENNGSVRSDARDVTGVAANETLTATSGAIYWQADSGNDKFTVSGGAHFFDGGPGTDTLIYSGPRSAARFDETTAGFLKLVNRTDSSASVVLRDVERIHFSDQRYAITVDGNPALATKLVGAVLGPNWARDPTVMGIAIDLLDGGLAPESMVALGLTTPMATAALGRAIQTDRDAVSLVFKNIVGATPDEATANGFLAQIGTGAGQKSLESLILAGAEHPLNLENIDLVGLSYEGLWYL